LGPQWQAGVSFCVSKGVLRTRQKERQVQPCRKSLMNYLTSKEHSARRPRTSTKHRIQFEARKTRNAVRDHYEQARHIPQFIFTILLPIFTPWQQSPGKKKFNRF
jgi:hypothetical protein